jgi:hypothetical protein
VSVLAFAQMSAGGVSHVPHEPPQPLSPQFSPLQFGMHCPLQTPFEQPFAHVIEETE